MLLVYSVSWEEKASDNDNFYSHNAEYFELSGFAVFLAHLAFREKLHYVRYITIDCHDYFE